LFVNPFLFGNPAGFGQQTAAARLVTALSQGNGMRGTARRRKRKSTKRAASTRRAGPKRKAGRARLVKGSAAAKRYMASIRRKRRK
jgi:hypothetical protein